MTDDIECCKDDVKYNIIDKEKVLQLEPTWAWLDGETFCPRTYEELLEFLKEETVDD